MDLINDRVKKIPFYIFSPPEKVKVVFVNRKTIKQLNFHFFNKNSPTDIISIKYSRKDGEIIVCVDECIKNSEFYNLSPEDEILFVVIHGFLHLKGYKDYKDDERKIMFEKTEEVFKNILKNEKKEKHNFN